MKMGLPLFLLLLSMMSMISPSSPSPISDLVSELVHLQSSSASSLIPLSDTLLNQILSLPPPRPFHFLIFFDAQQLHSKSELQLPNLKSQFALLSKSHSPSDIFFFALEFKDSQASFNLFGVNSLPHIKLIPPYATRKTLQQDSIKMEAADFARLADSMAEFVETHTGIRIQVIKPPIISKTQMGLALVVWLVSTPIMVKRVVRGDTLLHRKGMYLACGVFVYFFSVSGAMHNIIRKMPMFLADRDDPNKLVFFYQGSGMQLGAEGFFVGFLYTLVGLLLALMTHVLVRVRSYNVQRIVMILALIVSFWAVSKVVSLDNWKTGYAIHAYWPSSWN